MTLFTIATALTLKSCLVDEIGTNSTIQLILTARLRYESVIIDPIEDGSNPDRAFFCCKKK
jgi:hypothetical protein